MKLGNFAPERMNALLYRIFLAEKKRYLQNGEVSWLEISYLCVSYFIYVCIQKVFEKSKAKIGKTNRFLYECIYFL